MQNQTIQRPWRIERARELVLLPASRGDTLKARKRLDWLARCRRPALPQSICDKLEAALRASEQEHTHSSSALDEETLKGLRALSQVEYEKVRKRTAKTLGVRVAVLDEQVGRGSQAKGSPEAKQGRRLEFEDLTPWHEPVKGDALLDEICAVLRRYVVLPDGGCEAAALWIVFTDSHDCFEISPRLVVRSPEKRCGKTRVLIILGGLVSRPLPTSNVAPAALFRIIELEHPTLLIDEADTFARDNDTLRGIINSGHTHNGFVLRTVGEDFEPRKFSTSSALAIALIGPLPDTIEDRSIIINMRRKRPDEKVAELRLGRIGAELRDLARKCARWAQDNAEALRNADPTIPEELHDRAADNWRPLLAIADLAGGNWPQRARDVAVLLSGETAREESSAGVQLLADIRRIFEEKKVDRLLSEELRQELAKIEDSRWAEWNGTWTISPRQLARLLRPFGIRSKTIRTTEGTPKGYKLGDFEDAFTSYLPAIRNTATTETSSDKENDAT